MISEKDSAWDAISREMVCKLCGGRRPIGPIRTSNLFQLRQLFVSFEQEHICNPKEVKKWKKTKLISASTSIPLP